MIHKKAETNNKQIKYPNINNKAKYIINVMFLPQQHLVENEIVLPFKQYKGHMHCTCLNFDLGFSLCDRLVAAMD